MRTPGGDELPIFGEALAAEVGRRHGAPAQMMQTIARVNRNHAGIYAAVTRIGRLAVGQRIRYRSE